jgi:hypothetical protein
MLILYANIYIINGAIILLELFNKAINNKEDICIFLNIKRLKILII